MTSRPKSRVSSLARVHLTQVLLSTRRECKSLLGEKSWPCSRPKCSSLGLVSRPWWEKSWSCLRFGCKNLGVVPRLGKKVSLTSPIVYIHCPCSCIVYIHNNHMVVLVITQACKGHILLLCELGGSATQQELRGRGSQSNE